MNQKTYNIFPTIVKKVSYPNHLELKEYINKELPERSDIPTQTNKSRTISLYQTNDDKTFFVDDQTSIVQDLHEFCKKEFLKFAREDSALDMEEMYIVGSWINIYGENSGQTVHNHTNSFFSGNYYLNYDLSIGHKPLVLWNPYVMMSPGRPFMSQNRLQENLASAHFDYLEIKVNEGDLFLFPSHLLHSVEQTPENVGRTTISMNVMPSKLKNRSYCFEIVKKG